MVDAMVAILPEQCADHMENPPGMVKAIVSLAPIFGTDLGRELRFVDATVQWLARFYHQGVLTTIRQYFT